ncbi:Uncharacterised protein [Yersinia pseudotuberculosis]|uniref:hypothetical protein n=1 Tax=Yersinia pseudotuberculosis TaxID=633 RepID=UPI0005E5FBCD|nr:hypothetical protein [Yersinia pseudotuberculosis]CNC21982.1 Uncharacterised protein [Yersinia pseudotuberculosis]
MLRKTLIILIAVMALSSLGGVFLVGLNIYTRSTTPHETNATEADVTETDATETSLVPGIGPAGLSNTGQESP